VNRRLEKDGLVGMAIRLQGGEHRRHVGPDAEAEVVQEPRRMKNEIEVRDTESIEHPRATARGIGRECGPSFEETWSPSRKG